MFASTPKAAAFRDWAATVLTSPREAPPVAEPLLLDTPAPDNRDEIIALQRELIEAQRLLLGRPSREKKINVPWTPEQDARLVELANAAKIDWVRISTQMGRSRMSVASRGHILRVKGLING